MTSLPNPYVGPRAFNSGDPFFGRTREIRQLKSLLIAERLVLLHSPSGAGKTSLIQAGLLPEMARERFAVLPIIRVGLEPAAGSDAQTNRYALSTLHSLEEGILAENRIPAGQLPGLSLDEYLKRRYRPENAPRSELLVFDQFEEILRTTPNDRAGKQAFFAQLGAALNDPNRWALFAIREDYLGALSPYFTALPGHLRCQFRLDLIGREAALQAIQKPPRIYGVEFVENAANGLVDDLSSIQVQTPDGTLVNEPGMYIEPVQLQVVCYHLWQSLPEGDKTIDQDDLERVGDVDESIAEYYQFSVDQAVKRSGANERQLREWFENSLIRPGDIRGQVPMGAVESDGVSNLAIQQLIDAHIVRGEKRGTITWYELAHDRLVRPIRKNNADWFKENLKLFQQQATIWAQQGRSDGLLLRGKELDQAEQDAQTVKLTKDESAFLSDSREARAQADREKQNALRMDMLARAALARELAVRSQSFPLSNKETNILSGLLAVEAGKRWPGFEANQALHRYLNSPIFPVSEMQHDENITGVAFSPDGQWVVSGSKDNSARVWEAATGKEVARLKHDDDVTAVAFSPDGKWVVSGSADKTARVWEAATGKKVAQMEHADRVFFAAFSPDGKWVVSGKDDKTAQVWEAATGKVVAQMKHNLLSSLKLYLAHRRDHSSSSARVHLNMPHGLAFVFSPDGKWVASADEDHMAWVWEAVTGQEVAHMKHSAPIRIVAFSMDGKWVVSGDVDGVARVWEAATGKLIKDLKHYSPVTAVSFSPDGKWVALGSADKTARVWKVIDGKETARLQHEESVDALAFSPNGEWLVSGSQDHTVRLWETTAWKEVDSMKHDGPVNSIAFNPNGKWVVTGSFEDKTAQVWEIAAKEVARMRHNGPIQTISFSPNGEWVLSRSDDKTVRVWEAATGREVACIQHPFMYYINATVFSPDGKWVASGGQDETVWVWEAATGNKVTGMQHKRGIYAIAFSPDGQWVAGGGEDGTVWVWEAATGKEIAHKKHNGSESIMTLAFSPDGKWVASGGALDRKAQVREQPTARVWEASTGLEIAVVRHDGYVRAVTFSPDGKRVLSVSNDKTARVWEAATGTEVARMQYDLPIRAAAFSPDGAWVVSGIGESARAWEAATGKEAGSTQHDGTVLAVAFHPEGRLVVSGSEDKSARVWEAATGKEIARLLHDAPVTAVAFSPDGKLIISGDRKGNLLVWFSGTEDLVNAVCAKLPRNLTQVEWQKYIGDEPYQQTRHDNLNSLSDPKRAF